MRVIRRAALLAVVAVLAGGCTGVPTAGPDGSAGSDGDLVFTTPAPRATPVTELTGGSYVVGTDAALGRYASTADCRWVQRGLDGALLDRSGPARPTDVLTLRTTGSRLVVSAGCRLRLIP